MKNQCKYGTIFEIAYQLVTRTRLNKQKAFLAGITVIKKFYGHKSNIVLINNYLGRTY